MLRDVSVVPGRLLFWLIASGMLHLLVIMLPYSGKAGFRMEGAMDARGGLQLSVQRVALVPSVRGLALSSGAERFRVAPEFPPPLLSASRYEPMHPEAARADPPDRLSWPDAAYYPTHQLTVAPQPLAEPWLEPAERSEVPVSGSAVLELWINAQGEVVELTVEQSDLPDLFLRTVAKGFQTLGFKPGELNGQKVGSVMRIEVIYDEFRSANLEEP